MVEKYLFPLCWDVSSSREKRNVSDSIFQLFKNARIIICIKYVTSHRIASHHHIHRLLLWNDHKSARTWFLHQKASADRFRKAHMLQIHMDQPYKKSMIHVACVCVCVCDYLTSTSFTFIRHSFQTKWKECTWFVDADCHFYQFGYISWLE